ncbi:MAG: DNA-directed DNA polymerase II small subunit [Thermoplasma sp.]|nr:MAG: DNA-directed DNA polymerase II small subunit [Thermoplasma sp.]
MNDLRKIIHLCLKRIIVKCNMSQLDRTSLIQYFNSNGVLISPEALDKLIKYSSSSMIEEMIRNSDGYIDEKYVDRYISRPKIRNDYEVYLPDVRFNASIEDFRRMFVSKYEKIIKIITSSSSMRGSVSIKTAKRSQGEVKVVGMVSEVSMTKNGHKRIVIEDLEDSITAIVMKDRGPINEIILEDEVIGIIGSVSQSSKDPVIFVNEIIRPDIPYRVMDEEKHDPVYVASISDIHVGSKTFRKNEFESMVKWLASSDSDASKVKYLILSGDVVDGIGVYPDQENDLEILNPLEQYAKLAEYLVDVPEDIKVFVMPGNHDTVRLSEPQPVFPPRIRDLFEPNVAFLPNPYNLKLEGKNVLVYHGMSLNDMIELIPGANYDSIGKAIEAILIRRHLSPKYGGNTPMIPSAVDYHVIEEVPDIFITGHIHSHYIGNYKGVRYVNSSTWQSQTEYQKMMNFNPKPSKLTIFDLYSRSIIVKDFDTTS